MKLCIVATTSVTLRCFVLATAQYLHENGRHDVTLICNGDAGFANDVPHGIHYIPVAMKRSISLSGIISTIRLFRLFRRERFDLVQYSTPNAACYASIAAKIAKVPVRLYCQWGILYTGFHGLKRMIFKVVEKFVCMLSTHVEPDSVGNLRFSFDEILYPPEKGSVVWNGSACGVDLYRFNIEQKEQWRQEVRTRYNIPESSFVLGFVGRIRRDKGVNELLASFRDLLSFYPDSMLLLAGEYEQNDDLDPSLRQWSSEEKRVIWCGYAKDVEKCYAAMDLFVLPSYREGFGSVIIEAQAMGIPVVVTDIPGPSEAMVDGKTGLIVKKGDIEALTRAILKFASDTSLSNAFGKAGHQFAQDRFDQSVMMRKILEKRNKITQVI